MANFEQIDKARKVLGLGNTATMEEIKQAYRRKSLKYHPDKCKEKDKPRCERMIKKIISARDVMLRYCAGYRYSFDETEVRRNTTDKDNYESMKRFYDGWMTNL